MTGIVAAPWQIAGWCDSFGLSAPPAKVTATDLMPSSGYRLVAISIPLHLIATSDGTPGNFICSPASERRELPRLAENVPTVGQYAWVQLGIGQGLWRGGRDAR
jgi:hypothetical protein